MKKYLLGFTIGILCSATAVYAATKIMATDVSYFNSNPEVKTISNALDKLYYDIDQYKLDGNYTIVQTTNLSGAGNTTYTVSGHRYYLATFITNENWGAENHMVYNCQNAQCINLAVTGKRVGTIWALSYIVYVLPDSKDAEVTINLSKTNNPTYQGTYTIFGID